MTSKQITLEELGKLEVPYQRNKILAEHAKYKHNRDETVQERSFYKWFLPKTKGGQKDIKRPVTKHVQSIYRVKHDGGKEYLMYIVSYKSQDWRRNPIDFGGLIVGRYELPQFHVMTSSPVFGEIEDDGNGNGKAQQQQVQIMGHQTVYDIPFTKEKVKELVDMGPDNGTVSLIVVAPNRTKYSCNLAEFMNDSYDELIDRKSGFAEYLATRNANAKK